MGIVLMCSKCGCQQWPKRPPYDRLEFYLCPYCARKIYRKWARLMESGVE
jgi:hypothetical protein